MCGPKPQIMFQPVILARALPSWPIFHLTTLYILSVVTSTLFSLLLFFFCVCVCLYNKYYIHHHILKQPKSQRTKQYFEPPSIPWMAPSTMEQQVLFTHLLLLMACQGAAYRTNTGSQFPHVHCTRLNSLHSCIKQLSRAPCLAAWGHEWDVDSGISSLWFGDSSLAEDLRTPVDCFISESSE